MDEVAKVMSTATNYAVVQLPGRNYPGVVVQGDSLHALLLQVEGIRKLAAKHTDSELAAEVANLHDVLLDATTHFEMVCRRAGVGLPY